jgi:tetratricopeptide (TPR) repeat protein
VAEIGPQAARPQSAANLSTSVVRLPQLRYHPRAFSDLLLSHSCTPENPRLPPGFDSLRRPTGGAAPAAAARALLLILLLGAAIEALAGCAVLRRRGPNAESVAAARELSRQGVAAMEAGNWQQAEDLLNKAVIGAPEDTSTRRSLADALWHRGARQDAIVQIEKAVEHDSRNASLRVRAGEMALATGAYDAALKHAEKAIGHDPSLASAWALRGRCFRQLNHSDRALADLQHSLEFAPDCSDVLLEVAMIYRERGLPERSLTTLHRLLDTYSPGSEPQPVLLLEGVVLLEMGRPQQACEALAAAKARGNPSADGFYYLAQAYSAAGEPEQALVAAHEALALDASHQPSRELVLQLAARTTPGGVERR